MSLLCLVRTASQVWGSAKDVSKKVSERFYYEAIQAYLNALLECFQALVGTSKETVQKKAE